MSDHTTFLRSLCLRMEKPDAANLATNRLIRHFMSLSQLPVNLSRGAAAEGGDAGHRHKSVAAAFSGYVEICQLFSVRLKILEKALELVLHCVHLLAHVQNDFHSSEIYAEITC